MKYTTNKYDTFIQKGNYLPITSQITLPMNEIEISAVRAQGAGGQHVNKVSTAIHLRFDIKASSLPDNYKERLLHLKDQRITKEGIIILKAQEYRSQKKNKEIALGRLRDLIKSVISARKKRKPTRPTPISKTKRLDQKTKHGQLKTMRAKVVYLFWFISLFLPHDNQAQDIEAPGIPWVQYHSIDFKRVSDIGIDRQINMTAGLSSKDFSLFWLGMIRCPSHKPVKIVAEADDGLRLYIKDTMVIDGWRLDGKRQGILKGEKDEWLPFRLGYFQDGGKGFMRLYWSWDGHPLELIPATAYAYTKQQKDTVLSIAQELQADLTSVLRKDHSAIYGAFGLDTLTWTHPRKPVPVFPGPHLFLDHYLIAEANHIIRKVIQPDRDPLIPNPLITSGEDRCFQPFFTVSRAPETGRYRIWYGAWRDDKSHSRSHLAYMESEDGIHWVRPMFVCQTPEIQFGSEVIDQGPDYTDPQKRYLYGYWLKGGLRIAISADGLNWTALKDSIVLAHNHDITNIWRDPLRKRYVATVSSYMRSERWRGRRRTTMQSYSDDLLNWSPPTYVLYANPGKGDQGETQFYAMSGYLVRGQVIIGMVKVLRDDLIAEGVEAGSFGRAHTSLAWSYDGEHWIRDQSPFFEPDPDPCAWDHAHAWIDDQLIVGDTVRLYYGGYKQGHKMNRFRERQIGLVHMPLDRYVAWLPENGKIGKITTVPLVVNRSFSQLTVNAAAEGGKLTVALTDAQTGSDLPGFGFSECQPVDKNGLDINIQWGDEEITRKQLALLEGKTIRLQFKLENARLYAFEMR